MTFTPSTLPKPDDAPINNKWFEPSVVEPFQVLQIDEKFGGNTEISQEFLENEVRLDELNSKKKAS